MVIQFDKISASKLADRGNRKVWIALVMGIVFPGLGQLYNGQLILSITTILMVVSCHVLIAIPNPSLPEIMILCIIGIYFLAILQAVIRARKWRNGFVATKSNNWILYMVVLMIGIILTQAPSQVLYGFHKIESDCMQDIYNQGDVIYVNKLATLFGKPVEDDIVVFRPENNPADISLGRIWAEGENEIVIKENAIFLDGYQIISSGIKPAEITINQPAQSEMITRQTEKIVPIPENHYLVIGDNSFGWADETCTGIVPKTNLVGKIEYVFCQESEEHISNGNTGRLLMFYLFFY